MAKKTQQKRKRGSSGPEEHRRRQERLEQRRREREAAAEAERRAAARARIFRIAVVTGVLIAIGLWVFRPRNPAEIGGHPIRSLSTAGLQQHTQETVDYESSPPVSGAHSPSAAPCGVHGEQIQDELQVHSLEHGAVGVQFHPDLDPGDIEAIESIVGDYDSHVFSGPYEAMEPNIAVTSWGRMMTLDSLDESAVRDYVDLYRAKGPEDQDCPNTMDQPFEPPGGG